MPDVLCATDADRVFAAVDAALADAETHLHRVHAGREVLDAIRSVDPDLVVLDLQIGSMGGMATCMAIRLEEGAGRLEPRPVLMLLDRDHDRFLARRSEAEGWVVKPLDAFRLRRAAQALLAGDAYRENEPEPAPAEPSV